MRRRMVARFDKLLLACGTTALLWSCASPPEFTLRPKGDVAWPGPGRIPRIQLEMAYRGTMDVIRHPGFFGSIIPFVFGERGETFVSPYGLCLNEKVLWVADPGRSALHRLDLEDGEHRVLAAPEKHAFVTPISVVALPDRRIWVSDSTTGWISEFDDSGKWLRAFGGHAELERPTGMHVDASLDRALIVDTTACKIAVYDLEGNLQERFGERGSELGQFNYPTHVAISSLGTILVVDSLNFRVQAFTPDFEALGSFGVVGRGPGNFASPKGIAVDSQDHVYVVDSLFENVQIFDLTGQLLLAFCAHGRELGDCTLPTGIFIDDQDRIYLSDTGNSRIQIFRFHGGKE